MQLSLARPPAGGRSWCWLAAIIAAIAGCNQSSGATPPPVRTDTESANKAFPGAMGYGAVSQGGRGGRIIYVDSLEDSGEGTFRACTEAQGPRVCVFRVAGTVRFTRRPPVISNPYLTIAGQTAPGGGITLAHGGGETGFTPLLIKNTHDVIVRHIRIRNDRIGGGRSGEDSITIENSRNVIIDHVSASWARDEIVNGFGDNDNITVSWSLLAEGIPSHDKCALLASDPEGPQNFTFYGNLCAHNGDRNPDINFTPGSCAEIVNNVLYNPSSQFAEVWESYGGSPATIVGNVFRKGPNTADHAVGIDREVIGSRGRASIYHFGNRFDGSFVQISPKVAEVEAEQPSCPLTMKPLPADRAFAEVLAKAGAWPRDAFDTEIVSDVQNRVGGIVRTPGEIPAAADAQPYEDTDRDGMADAWEAAHGAEPMRPDAWEDADQDGTANLDAFLADLHTQALSGTSVLASRSERSSVQLVSGEVLP